MMMKKDHEHNWLFERESCCFVLKCSNPKCQRETTAYYIKGKRPKIGDPVRILEDGRTIELIGPQI